MKCSSGVVVYLQAREYSERGKLKTAKEWHTEFCELRAV
jgi:hypothetical protein